MPNFEFKKIDWKKFEKPSPLFQVLKRTEEKDKLVASELKNGFLNMSDEYRDYQSIYKLMNYYYYHSFSIIYEVGNFGAIFGFVNIIPGFKCDILMKFWDKTLWKPSFVKETRKLIKLFIKQLDLHRVSAETPDEKVEHMAHLCGLETEGIKTNDFRWNGRLYNNIILGIVA